MLNVDINKYDVIVSYNVPRRNIYKWMTKSNTIHGFYLKAVNKSLKRIKKRLESDHLDKHTKILGFIRPDSKQVYNKTVFGIMNVLNYSELESINIVIGFKHAEDAMFFKFREPNLKTLYFKNKE